jgi:hypothetical protein
MDITTIITKIKIECTDDKGYLLKNKFKVALIFKLIELFNQGLFTVNDVKELNKQISLILGQGNSLKSCEQFFKGKKAIPIIEAFCKQDSSISLNVDFSWIEFLTKQTFH